jgi:hypothetical protein
MKAFILIPLLAAGSVHGQGCFGPVVAGECHDAQSEMRRIEEFQRQHEDQVRQGQERRTARPRNPDRGARSAERRVARSIGRADEALEPEALITCR